MKNSILFLASLLFGLHAVLPVAAGEFYPDFALVVQLPSYEAFLTNLGESPIRVDGYLISSASGSLDPAGWAPMDHAGPEIVKALGFGADQFHIANPSAFSLAELNPTSYATWQHGQQWSIGFPFRSGDPNFVFDPVFQIASPDGLVLTGGTVVPPSALALAVVMTVPEPSAWSTMGAALSVLMGCSRGIRPCRACKSTKRRLLNLLQCHVGKNDTTTAFLPSRRVHKHKSGHTCCFKGQLRIVPFDVSSILKMTYVGRHAWPKTPCEKPAAHKGAGRGLRSVAADFS